jgi:hypothetical protein
VTEVLALDTNLLVLLIVARVDEQLIGRHKRLKDFVVPNMIDFHL